MVCSVGELSQGQEEISAAQIRIQEAEDSIANLKDKNAALQEEVTFIVLQLGFKIIFSLRYTQNAFLAIYLMMSELPLFVFAI